MAIQDKTSFEAAKEVVKKGLVNHIAIIMDGNRRWAKLHNLPKTLGHTNGRKTFKNIVKHSAELGLGYLTTYAFSTENWGRSEDEIRFLMDLLIESLNAEIKELHENNIKVSFIGRKDRFSKKIVDKISESEQITMNNTGLSLQLALDYGSRDEIAHAVRKIAEDVNQNKQEIDQIDDKLINSYLYTSDIPDPDLIIRTGGEYRLSNFLLWQAAYSELYFTQTFWPDFSSEELNLSIINFSQRQRRWGKD